MIRCVFALGGMKRGQSGFASAARLSFGTLAIVTNVTPMKLLRMDGNPTTCRGLQAHLQGGVTGATGGMICFVTIVPLIAMRLLDAGRITRLGNAYNLCEDIVSGQGTGVSIVIPETRTKGFCLRPFLVAEQYLREMSTDWIGLLGKGLLT